MKKIVLAIILSLFLYSHGYSQAGSYAGAFSRLGFGARGLAMGNAMVSNIFVDVAGYYNPALATFQEEGIVNVGYTFLSLDRQLNFLGFAKKFKLPNQPDGGAGISISWINSGVNDIDGRDNDTRQIGTFSTFDNQFSLGTGFILSKQISIGVGFKYYFSKLFDEVTSSSIAFDIGGIFKAREDLAFGFSVRDLGAKNEWTTTDLYGSQFGNNTEDKYPTLINVGGSYLLPKNLGVVSLEVEFQSNPAPKPNANGVTNENSNNTFFKLGGEINLIEQLKLRAGIERIDFASDDIGGNLKPAIGFGYYKNFGKDMLLGLDYSFQLEPYTHEPIQNISLGFKFK